MRHLDRDELTRAYAELRKAILPGTDNPFPHLRPALNVLHSAMRAAGVAFVRDDYPES
jgi:hypothetical protein